MNLQLETIRSHTNDNLQRLHRMNAAFILYSCIKPESVFNNQKKKYIYIWAQMNDLELATSRTYEISMMSHPLR